MKLDEILASWENRPEAFTGQKVDVATFIGPNSAAWQSGAYQQALEMEKKGVSPKDIWQRTGTGRNERKTGYNCKCSYTVDEAPAGGSGKSS